jgi:hypothetical protein
MFFAVKGHVTKTLNAQESPLSPLNLDGPGRSDTISDKNSSGLLGTLVTITGEEIPATADRRVTFPHHELHHG